MSRTAAAFARMHDRLFAHFGEQAVLRMSEPVEAVISSEVQLVGDYAPVPQQITAATLRASVNARQGDRLAVGGQMWELDAQHSGDADVQTWVLRKATVR